jgi:hypothetical protein
VNSIILAYLVAGLPGAAACEELCGFPQLFRVDSNNKATVEFRQRELCAKSGQLMRNWLKRHFANMLGTPLRRDEFEHCTACGQPFNTRDLHQVLPHFEHQLALAPRPLEESSPDEDLRSPVRKVVPFRASDGAVAAREG